MADLSLSVSDSERLFENVMFGKYDSHYNNAYSTVATVPSPALSGTQLTLNAGDGNNFSPGTYNATIWPAGGQPSNSNSEIVRITGKSGDILQIQRTQENSSARSILVGDQIASSITAKTVTDVEGLTYNSVKFSVYKSGSAQTINTSYTQVSFDIKDYDTGGNYSTSSNNFTAPIAGFYSFKSGLNVTNNGSLTYAGISLYKNGSQAKEIVQLASSTLNTSLFIAYDLQLSLGDTIAIYAIGGGNAFSCSNTSIKTYFCGSLVSQL